MEESGWASRNLIQTVTLCKKRKKKKKKKKKKEKEEEEKKEKKKKIILCRRLRDGNPCLKDQLEDLKQVGKMILVGMKSMNVRNWKKVAENRDRWKKVVEQVRTLYRF